MGYKQQQERRWNIVDQAKNYVLANQDEHQQHNCIQEYNLPRLARRRLAVDSDPNQVVPTAFQHL